MNTRTGQKLVVYTYSQVFLILIIFRVLILLMWERQVISKYESLTIQDGSWHTIYITQLMSII